MMFYEDWFREVDRVKLTGTWTCYICYGIVRQVYTQVISGDRGPFLGSNWHVA